VYFHKHKQPPYLPPYSPNIHFETRLAEGLCPLQFVKSVMHTPTHLPLQFPATYHLVGYASVAPTHLSSPAAPSLYNICTVKALLQNLLFIPHFSVPYLQHITYCDCYHICNNPTPSLAFTVITTIYNTASSLLPLATPALSKHTIHCNLYNKTCTAICSLFHYLFTSMFSVHLYPSLFHKHHSSAYSVIAFSLTCINISSIMP
jgi:hypothetical protein